MLFGNKYYKVVVLFIVSFLVFPFDVFGKTFSCGSKCYQYNHSTGAYGGSGCADYVKTDESDNYAFCSEFANKFSGSSCTVDSSWNKTKKYAIVVGHIVDTVFRGDAYKSYDETKKYGVTSIAINTYLANNYASSWGKYSRGSGRLANDGNYLNNKTIKAIITAAEKAYSEHLVTKTKLPAVSLTVSNSTLKPVGNYYVSDKITAKGLKSNYGGGDRDNKNGTVTYTISAKVNSGNGTVVICSDAAATSCSNQRKIEGKSADQSFYLKVRGSDISNKTITVTVEGSNVTAYHTSVRYECGAGKQHLIFTDSQFEDVSRSVRKSVQLKTPSTTTTPDPEYVQHQITALKIDENGDLLNGASLELYQGDPDNGGKKLPVSNNGASEISYTFDQVKVGDPDPAYNYDYYILETSSPDGYKINRVKQVFDHTKFSGATGTSTKCYNIGDSDSSNAVEESDPKYCEPSNYEYWCQPSDGTAAVPPAEGGSCSFPTEGGNGTLTGGDDTEGSTGGEGDTSTDPEPPVVTWEPVCWDKTTNAKATKDYCAHKDRYVKVVITDGNIVVTHTNEKNKVIISKRALTGDDEVPGAQLKICTAESYKAKKNDCDVAKTIIDEVPMSWTSTNQPQEWQGLKAGEYYIVEVVQPLGYQLATQATSFSIDAEGKVTTGGTVLKDGDPIIIKNTLNKLSVSKQDVATSQELPGATISICSTYKDENGEYKVYIETDPSEEAKESDCIPAVLADGTAATWESLDKPHEVIGLPAGTYSLVEKIAPNGYSTAESILFTLKDDGTIVDKDGNSIKDSTLVMKDSKLEEVKTGQLSLYIISGLTIVMIGVGAGTYYLMGQKKIDVIKKIRKRKIHSIRL